MSKVINIAGMKVGNESKVFVTAEIGINHNGDMMTAEKLIKAAKDAGVDAVKLQSYITEKRVPSNSPIFGILKKCELSFEQQKELFDYANSLNIIIYSTPFDEESVDFLESINCCCYKVASFDIPNHKIIDKLSKTKKPIIVSRGMASREELDSASNIIKRNGSEFAILHCISAYPVKSQRVLNLKTIKALSDIYQCPVGFSDHTIGIETVKFAVAAGAELIEKHFTLSKNMEGPDHVLSTEPSEIKAMVCEIRKMEEILGSAVWNAVNAEQDILQYRRISKIDN